MSKQVLEPPDGKAAPVEADRKNVPPTAQPIIRLPEQETLPGKNGWWQALPTQSRFAFGGGVVLVVLLIFTLLVALLGGGSTPTKTTSKPVPQVQVPTHQTYDAQPPAAQQGETVNINLVAKEALISIAPGVAYHAWTFNGSVPGPVLRVRVGQTVHFTLTNDASMPHSIDFHAAQTPWDQNYQPIAPGQSFSFDWKANYPGVFMYHCGTPPVMMHMANGMYGAIIVDPAEGWAPAQEYVLVQSEFYMAKAPDGSYNADMDKMMMNAPDYVVFNGYSNQYKDTPLQAKAGQHIRLFLLNAGPSLFSAFHVIGAIFSDTYMDGNPANHMQGNQTVIVAPGGGYVVELTIPDPCKYPFVTHSFSAAMIGALGVLQVNA
jgi:nitrite reductase (NO-forming)